MPLEVRTIVDLREEVVERVKDGLSISEAARLYGVSRPSVYEWLRRYEGEGREGLVDRSRAPRSCPHKTADYVVERLIEERRKWRFGSKAILQRLIEQEPDVVWPARSTADDIFRRAGLVLPRRKRERKRVTPFVKPYAASRSGELLTVDFKGQFRLKNGQLCYPLTLVDSVSRYLLACQALSSTHEEPAWRVVDRMFRRWGLPEAVQSDNGVPFGASGAGRLSTFSVRLMKLDILPVFSRPAKPQDNGAHERMHRTLKERATIPPSHHGRAQQRRFNDFRWLYNEERPHEGISMRRPARLWHGCIRPYPSKPLKIDYEPWYEVRKVGHSGMLSWRSGQIFISHALGNEWIGLEPADADRWNLYFGRFFLGQIDERINQLI